MYYRHDHFPAHPWLQLGKELLIAFFSCGHERRCLDLSRLIRELRMMRVEVSPGA
jgi:hypothetical protein